MHLEGIHLWDMVRSSWEVQKFMRGFMEGLGWEVYRRTLEEGLSLWKKSLWDLVRAREGSARRLI